MKRIIEIEESDLERIREIVERENKTALSVTTRGTAYIAIAQSKLYTEPTGDLISRSEAEKLGATCLARRNENGQLEAIISLDLAPIVDLWQMRQEATENALKKAEVLYGRPQGEWVDREYRMYFPRDAEPDYNDDTYDEKTHSVMRTHIVCSNCGAERRFYHNFCGNCGADMRKGGADNEKTDK